MRIFYWKYLQEHAFLHGHADYDHARFSHYVLTEYINQYDVMSYSGIVWNFFYENNILMPNWAEFIHAKSAKKCPHKSSHFFTNIPSGSRDFFPN